MGAGLGWRGSHPRRALESYLIPTPSTAEVGIGVPENANTPSKSQQRASDSDDWPHGGVMCVWGRVRVP